MNNPRTSSLPAYAATRTRMTQIAQSLSPGDLRRAVPACPLWTVFDLIAHVVSMPAAIGNGESPPGPVSDWLQVLVEARRNRASAN